MGRKSSLSDTQWAEVGRRLLEGEGPSEIARDLTAQGLTIKESTIRSHFDRKGESTPKVREVADMVLKTERALAQLPPDAQVSAINLAAKLRSVSESLACAAENSAMTSLRLTALANAEIQKVDDADPLKNADALKSVVVLTKAANEAAHIPLNLLSANKDAAKRFTDEPPPAPGEVYTPERMADGARRLAFVLHRAAALETS